MRTASFYYDLVKNVMYDTEGNAVNDSNRLRVRYRENIELTLQYVTDSALTAYTGFATGVSANSAAAKTVWAHTTSGTLSGALSGAVTSIIVDSMTIRPADTGTLTLTNSSGETETVAYTAISASGTTYTFTVDDTLTYTYAADDTATAPSTLIFKCDDADIDDTDAATGIFVFTIDANTQAFQAAISGSRSLSTGIFEHQILDVSSNIISAVSFPIILDNILDDGAAVPAATTGNYYTKTEGDARYVELTDYDANTILAATADNTPVAVTVAESTILGRAAGGSIDDLSAAQVLTILGLDSNLANLTTAEVQQLENIGATTISAAQWGYLGGTDQALATTDSVTFSSLTLTTALAVAHGGTGSTTASDARTALGLAIGSDVQAYDAGLASIAGLTTAADKLLYTTASDTYAVTDLTSYARTLLDDADAATARGTLNFAAEQSHITDASTAHDLNATYSDTEVEAALDALGTTINSILAALEAHNLVADA